MSKHSIDIDIQKMAQDIHNIRHFLNHLEKLIEDAIIENKRRPLDEKDHGSWQ